MLSHRACSIYTGSCHGANFVVISGIIMTTCDATCDEKVGILTSLGVQYVSLTHWPLGDVALILTV